jgi:hypothetical protein
MEELGPAFSAFGRYLSGRIDLLPCGLCEDLSAIPDHAAPETAECVRDIFIREIGAPPERAFQWFDPQPRESRLYWQSHDARLAGADVNVRFIRPAIPEWIENADNLEVLQEALVAGGLAPDRFRQAAAEFVRELRARQSFESELSAFASLARDAHSFDDMAASKIYQHLSTRYVLVHDSVHAITSFNNLRSPDQARKLCLAWLRQALGGEVYPVEPHLGNVAFTADGRITFTDGPFAAIPTKRKTHLSEYLAAIAADDSKLAFTHFTKAISDSRDVEENPELRRRFLQMVSFRDGFRNDNCGLGSQPEFPPFTEQVLIHWRLARAYGELDESVNAFYRGLLHIVRTAAVLAPGRDSLLEALYDLRIRAVFGNAKELLRPAEVAGLMEQYATALLAMPANMDHLLTQIASGELPPIGSRESSQRRVPGNRLQAPISFVLALGAAGLLLQRVEASARSPSLDQLLMVLFLGFGCVLLWMGSRLN